MKIAVFSDVHGNLLNLVSCYESISRLNVDACICLGDIGNYYPETRGVIGFLKQKSILCLRGNHDQMYLSPQTLSDEKKAQYSFDLSMTGSPEYMEYFSSLPLTHELAANGRRVLFCHASPVDPLNTYVYPDSDLSVYADIPYDIVFMGHTHRQFLRRQGDKWFCNVGSVGLPRDNGSLMGFAIFDTSDGSIVLYRKKIDAERIKEVYSGRTTGDVLRLLDRQEEIHYSYLSE